MKSELRPPAVNSVKRGKVFVIQTPDKVDSPVRVTLSQYSGQLFSLQTGYDLYKCFNIFYVFFKKLAGQHERNVPHFGRNRWLVVIFSSVTRYGRNNKQCVLLEIEYVK